MSNHENVNVGKPVTVEPAKVEPAKPDQGKAVDTKPPATPAMAPTTAVGAGTGQGAGTLPTGTAKPASDAPTGTTGKVEAKPPVEAGKPAGTGDTAKPAPQVLTVTPKPERAKGENNKHYAKRLAQWQAGQGKPPATPDKPAGTGDTGKGETKPPAISAAKPAKVTPRQAALANPDLVAGYDFSQWPAWCTLRPSREAIMAARSFGLHDPLTKNELSIAMSIEQGNPLNTAQFNVYDYGVAYNAVPQVNRGGTGKPDHKMNATLNAAEKGWLRLKKGACMGQNPASTLTGGKAKAVYRGYLTGKALKQVEAYFSANGLKVPRWLSDPDAVEAEMAAAADRAAKQAAKAARSNVPA